MSVKCFCALTILPTQLFNLTIKPRKNTINTTSYIFKEDVNFFVLLWIDSGLKQRKEYVLQHLGKVRHELLCLENVAGTHKYKLCYILQENLKTDKKCFSIINSDHDKYLFIFQATTLTISWALESSTSCWESILYGK